MIIACNLILSIKYCLKLLLKNLKKICKRKKNTKRFCYGRKDFIPLFCEQDAFCVATLDANSKGGEEVVL